MTIFLLFYIDYISLLLFVSGGICVPAESRDNKFSFITFVVVITYTSTFICFIIDFIIIVFEFNRYINI